MFGTDTRKYYDAGKRLEKNVRHVYESEPFTHKDASRIRDEIQADLALLIQAFEYMTAEQKKDTSKLFDHAHRTQLILNNYIKPNVKSDQEGRSYNIALFAAALFILILALVILYDIYLR